MAFDKTELKQLQFLFKESEKRTEKNTKELILESEKRTENNTKHLILESEKRTEKKTREIIQSETRKIVRAETKLVICEALEELVLPRLQAVEDKQEEHTETLQEHSDSLERIENIQRVETKRDDGQDEKIEEHDFKINKIQKVLVVK